MLPTSSVTPARNGMSCTILVFMHPPRIASKISHSLRLFAICAVWLSAPLMASAASFPCEKAATEVERAICKDKELSWGAFFRWNYRTN